MNSLNLVSKCGLHKWNDPKFTLQLNKILNPLYTHVPKLIT